MKILPFYDKKVTIAFMRGNDEQKLTLVDTDGEEVRNLIVELFRDRFTYPGRNMHNETKVLIAETDMVKGRINPIPFIYTKKGVEHEVFYAHVANLSPRQVRIELETAVRKMK